MLGAHDLERHFYLSRISSSFKEREREEEEEEEEGGTDRVC